MILQCENLHKRYGEIEVLRGIDFSLSPSEIVSIVGPSGAGKTTLLQILGTLMAADSGVVTIADTQVSKLNHKQLAKLRNSEIGFVFQFHHLLPEFSAIENVMIPALIAGRSQTEAQKRAEELLELVGLAARGGHKPSAMSGGEQQRVAVARALINNPKIIFADEPSGNLDSANREELHSLFFEVRRLTGAAFLIVTHDTDLAQRSDRTITMRDGLICEK